jgi:hypothetical protein
LNTPSLRLRESNATLQITNFNIGRDIPPLSPEPEIALRDAAAMEAILTDADITIPQAHHGYDGSCWAVNERALMRGHGMRTGLEDAILLPDGRPANSNGEMAEAAKQLIADVASRR